MRQEKHSQNIIQTKHSAQSDTRVTQAVLISQYQAAAQSTPWMHAVQQLLLQQPAPLLCL